MSSEGIRGKVFAVSGAASGIGRATAVRLSELGAQGLALSDVETHGLEETKKLCMLCLRCLGMRLTGEGLGGSTEITTHLTDVSKVEDVNGWIDDTVKRFGRLDGAANIAGIALGDGQPTENTVQESHLPRRRLSDEMTESERVGQDDSCEPHRRHERLACRTPKYNKARWINRQHF